MRNEIKGRAPPLILHGCSMYVPCIKNQTFKKNVKNKNHIKIKKKWQNLIQLRSEQFLDVMVAQ